MEDKKNTLPKPPTDPPALDGIFGKMEKISEQFPTEKNESSLFNVMASPQDPEPYNMDTGGYSGNDVYYHPADQNRDD